MNIPYEIAIKGKDEIEKYVTERKEQQQAGTKQWEIARDAHKIIKRIYKTTTQTPFTMNTKYDELFILAHKPETVWRVIQSLRNDLDVLEEYTLQLIDNKHRYIDV